MCEYETTTDNGRYRFLIEGNVPKVYEEEHLIDQGDYAWTTLLRKLRDFESALLEIQALHNDMALSDNDFIDEVENILERIDLSNGKYNTSQKEATLSADEIKTGTIKLPKGTNIKEVSNKITPKSTTVYDLVMERNNLLKELSVTSDGLRLLDDMNMEKIRKLVELDTKLQSIHVEYRD